MLDETWRSTLTETALSFKFRRSTFQVSFRHWTSKASSSSFFFSFQWTPFTGIYYKTWTTSTISCLTPGWTHLRWSRRSLCRTCSSPECCTCRSPTCSRRWWWSWQTCLTQTSGCNAHRRWSPGRSSARWPLARGCPKCCRWDWEPEVEKCTNIPKNHLF